MIQPIELLVEYLSENGHNASVSETWDDTFVVWYQDQDIEHRCYTITFEDTKAVCSMRNNWPTQCPKLDLHEPDSFQRVLAFVKDAMAMRGIPIRSIR